MNDKCGAIIYLSNTPYQSCVKTRPERSKQLWAKRVPREIKPCDLQYCNLNMLLTQSKLENLSLKFLLEKHMFRMLSIFT